MKKVFAIIAAILFCGATMVSCNKENNTENNDSNSPTKTDMVGTWEGSFAGSTTIDNANENYTLNWTLILNPEGSATIGSLKYTTTFDTYRDLNGEVPVTDYYVRQNTSTGRIVIVGGHNFGLIDEMIDFDIDLNAKTMKGTLEVNTSLDQDVITLGGATTLHKK